MTRRMVMLCIAITISLGASQLLFSEDKIPGDILVRGSVGFDPIGGGIGFGGGAGYRFSIGSAYNEVIADFFYSSSKETSTEGNWRYNYQDWLYIFGVRWDWLFLYTPRENGFYALAGAGFWFGSFEWEEKSTYIPDGSAGPTGGAEGSSGGSIFNLGAAWIFSKRWEARLELPILISFSSYYRSTGVAIPITASIMYAF